MELWTLSKIKINKDENGENVPSLEITLLVLIRCIIVNNNFQQDSRALFAFASNKSFGQLSDISPKSFIFLTTFNSEFSYIEVWITDQNSKLLETDNKISIFLATNWSVKSKK